MGTLDVRKITVRIACLAVFLLSAQRVYTQVPALKSKFQIDTTTIGKTDRIYQDTIIYNYLRNRMDTAENKHRFTRFIFKTFTNKTPDSGLYHRRPVPINIYSKFKNMVIDSVVIRRNMPYPNENRNDRSLGARLRRGANAAHMLTRERIIEKNLLFKPGERLNPLLMERNEYILRNQNNLANVYFVVRQTGPDSVNVYVYTIDKLSISVGVDYNGKNTNSKIHIGENNFMGLGNQLLIYDYFNLGENRLFKGGEVSHNFTNIYGTFFNLRTNAGAGKDFYIFKVESNKNFIRQSDYAGGINYLRDKEFRIPAFTDTLLHLKRQRINIWAGKSFKLNNRGMSIYATSKFETQRYFSKPETGPALNSYFHNRDDFIASVGIYKERFYQGNLIYGFGYIEDIPYGFKAEFSAGYRWSQFHNYPYMGLSLAWAHRTAFGYINTAISTGAFWDRKGTFFDRHTKIQHITHLNLFYFSNLIELRRDYNLRFFVTGDYMTGRNMMNGEGQRISFTGDYKLRGISIKDYVGTTRGFLSPELVLFTPLHVLGFRFAFYGYADLGSLGNSVNPFRNSFYGSAGLGIRIRNESLVFRTIQIGFSVMLRNNAYVRSNWFDVRSEKKLGIERLIPTEPRFVTFE